MDAEQLLNAVAAVGALGAAAFGLVDVSKGLWINVGNSGFTFITDSLAPFDAALKNAVGKDQSGKAVEWQDLLWAHWLNGRDIVEQKAIAKSLIRLGLDQGNADGIAKAVNVSATDLQGAVSSLQNGTDLTPQQLNVLGRVDAAIDARLDAAFERADRRYRSVARNLAGAYAVVLAVIGGAVMTVEFDYWRSADLIKAVIVGLIAVPVAPMTKDLVSGLKAAMDAVKVGKP